MNWQFWLVCLLRANQLILGEWQETDARTTSYPELQFDKVSNPSVFFSFFFSLRSDRNRDARIAIGTSPLPRKILSEFVEKLGPYRRPTLSRIKTSLYLCTSTLQSKVLPAYLLWVPESRKEENVDYCWMLITNLMIAPIHPPYA
jgi:hypothetical protein